MAAILLFCTVKKYYLKKVIGTSASLTLEHTHCHVVIVIVIIVVVDCRKLQSAALEYLPLA
jgi:hypothetical protein